MLNFFSECSEKRSVCTWYPMHSEEIDKYRVGVNTKSDSKALKHNYNWLIQGLVYITIFKISGENMTEKGERDYLETKPSC